jgi:hypothetical protein
MKVFAMIAVSSLLFLGCSKPKDSAATGPEAQEAPAAAPTAVAPSPTPAPAAETEAAAETARKPIGDYIGAAVKTTVYAVKLGASGAEKTQTNVLDEAATKAYLGTLDLTQRADGPVAKCPSDTLVELADAGGALLGTIGLCQGKAAFTLPDGTTPGGIRASAP